MTDEKTPTAVPAGEGEHEHAEASSSDEVEEKPLPTFAEMGLKDELLKALADMGYETPMEVQSAVFEHVMAGRDVTVESHTGSGKTTAFGLPMIQQLDPNEKGVKVLILAPTRELALQVSKEIAALTAHTALECVAIYGGAPMKPQIDALSEGAQIVAGTPGRVLDHIRRRNLKTSGLRFLVLDECDEMLSMGFREEIDNIINTLPSKEERQTLLFSATIPAEIQRISKRHLTDPVQLSLSKDSISVEEIDHFYYVVSGMARTRDLLKILQTERPESAIIFCNTREDTNTVARYLIRHGYDAEAISGELSQSERERVMKRTRDKNLRFMVATDIAARGIDISDLSHVINYSFPESPEVYVHRTGRTGRAGKKGTALSLVGPREIGSFYYLKLIYKIRPVERELPTAEELTAMQEGENYDRVVRMVPEQPAEQFVSLARRLWQSDQGERVVGALLERLFSKPPVVQSTRPAPEERETRHGRARRVTRTERGGRADRDGSRRRPKPREDNDRDQSAEEKSAAAPETSGETTSAATGETTHDTSETTPGEAVEAKERDSGASDQVTRDDEQPRRKRRRRRRKRSDGDSGGEASTASDGDNKEFWETWADEKTNGSTAKPDSDTAGADDEQAGGGAETGGDGTIRLYVNIGRREEATVEDLRTLLAEGIGDDAERIGRIALRNTHAYVRVPEDLVERIIEASKGKSFRERELIVEVARR